VFAILGIECVPVYGWKIPGSTTMNRNIESMCCPIFVFPFSFCIKEFLIIAGFYTLFLPCILGAIDIFSYGKVAFNTSTVADRFHYI
jgi:hypothetical protein